MAVEELLLRPVRVRAGEGSAGRVPLEGLGRLGERGTRTVNFAGHGELGAEPRERLADRDVVATRPRDRERLLVPSQDLVRAEQTAAAGRVGRAPERLLALAGLRGREGERTFEGRERRRGVDTRGALSRGEEPAQRVVGRTLRDLGLAGGMAQLGGRGIVACEGLGLLVGALAGRVFEPAGDGEVPCRARRAREPPVRNLTDQRMREPVGVEPRER